MRKSEVTAKYAINKQRIAALAMIFVLAGCAREVIVHEPARPDRLNEVGERITDEAIREDRAVIDGLRLRLRALNDSGLWPMDNYQVCKAQAWIDFAEVEYTDNDRGTVVESALNQARALIDAMQAGVSPLPTNTPMLDESMVVRQDLWDLVARTKQANARECLGCTLAKLEVQLIAAGHDRKELGERHAESGILASERLAREAGTAGQCPAAGARLGPVMASAVGLIDGGPTPAELRIPVVVHFAYDSALLSDETASILTRVSKVMRDYPQITVVLEGHTDLRGGDDYNVALGKRRATAVRRYLLTAGIVDGRISEVSKGERESLLADIKTVKSMALDRRVELRFDHLPEAQVRTERQQTDVQADR